MTALLIIVAIIVVVLIIPFGATIRYCDDDFALAVRVLLFDIGVFPGKEKAPGKEKPKKEKKPKPKKEKPEGEKPKKKLSFTKDELVELIALALKTAAKFPRKLVVNNFKLYYVSADKDPYEAATQYGYVNTALGLLTGPASNTFNVRRSDIQTAVDFERTEPYIDFALTFTFTLGKLFAIIFSAGFGFLGIKLRASKEKSRSEAAEERTDKDGTDELPHERADAGQHE